MKYTATYPSTKASEKISQVIKDCLANNINEIVTAIVKHAIPGSYLEHAFQSNPDFINSEINFKVKAKQHSTNSYGGLYHFKSFEHIFSLEVCGFDNDAVPALNLEIDLSIKPTTEKESWEDSILQRQNDMLCDCEKLEIPDDDPLVRKIDAIFTMYDLLADLNHRAASGENMVDSEYQKIVSAFETALEKCKRELDLRDCQSVLLVRMFEENLQ